jgi:Flp pilus assembly protein TadD
MKKIIIFCIILFNSLVAIGQPDKQKLEQLKAQLEMIQKRADSMNNALKNGTVKQAGKRPQVNAPGTTITNQELPKPDTLKIYALPKKILSLPELANYTKSLHEQLEKKLPPAMVKNAKAIAAELGNDPLKMEGAAWYAFQNSKYAEAVLLITEASISKPNDGLLLTNAGAILDMSGLSDKAIPILRTTIQHDPTNGIAINNLAQAYCALGMIDSAMLYLNTCVRLSPEHPEANNTAGQIELARGNKAKAKIYFENAIRGGFSASAYQGLRSIDKNDKNSYKIKKLISPKIKFPEYFNQYKYKLPRLCTNVAEAEAVKAEQEAFIKMINNAKDKIDKLRNAREKNMASFSPEAYNKQVLEKISNKQPVARPFQVMAAIVAAETTNEYREELLEIQKFNTQNREQLKALYKQYEAEYEVLKKSFDKDDDKCCGEGDVSCCTDPTYCIKVNALRNKYLVLFLNVDMDWQNKNLAFQRKYLDDLLYWEPLAANSTDEAYVRFYNWAGMYLGAIAEIANTSILEPCKTEKQTGQDAKDSALKTYDCDIEFQAKFLVGKFTLDCEKFSMQAGELLIGKIERNFTTRQTTLSLGVGVYEGLGGSFAGIGAGAEVGMSMSAFLTIDKTGALTDGGIVNSASASAGVNFKAGEKLGFTKKLAEQKVEFESRLGINSGWSFNEGPLKNILTPQEKPLNKNVKVYPQK